MKTTIPEQSVDVCDFCRKTGYLQACWVCGREFCLTHQGTVAGSGGFTRVCFECSTRSDVFDICNTYSKKLQPIYRARNDELKKLPIEAEKS